MKKILIVILLVSASAGASECLTKITNLSLTIKLKAVLAHRLEENQADICSESHEDWEDHKNQKLKMLRLLKSEMKNKKKVSADFLLGINDDISAEDELTEPELCDILNKEIKKYADEGSCFGGKSFYHRYTGEDLTGMSFQEACKKMAPEVKGMREKCMNENKESFVREPPGEEIAPAEEPVKNKPPIKLTPVNKIAAPVRPAPTESSGRAKVRMSSGASRQ